ncbi:MAG: TolC family protein [Gammaproteobacteria bacterium]|nr:TolC family protein [Gammaproteobacteria bacterium]
MKPAYRALAAVVVVLLGGCGAYVRPLTAAQAARALPRRPFTAVWAAYSHRLVPALPPLEVRPHEGLTPAAAAVWAVVADPDLRAARSAGGIAQAQLLAAGLLPNPVFSLSAGLPISGLGLTDAFRAALSLPIRALVTRPARVAAARARLRRVDLTLAWQAWQVALHAKDDVYQLGLLARERGVLHTEIGDLRRQVALLARGERARVVTAGVRQAALLALRHAQLEALQVAALYRLKLLALKGLLGLKPGEVLRFAPQDNRRFRAPVDRRALFAGLAQRRLDLVALRAGYRAPSAAVRVAVLGEFPPLALGINRARDTTDVNTIGADLSVALPIFNHNQGAVAIAQATRRSLLRTYAARLADARLKIAELITSLHAARREIRARRQVVRTLVHLEGLYRQALAEHAIDALVYYQLAARLTRERLQEIATAARLDQLGVALETESGWFELPKAPP